MTTPSAESQAVFLALVSVTLVACAASASHSSTASDTARATLHRPASPQNGQVRAGTPDSVNIAAARAAGNARTFDWMPWEPATFERARAEHKLILVDGAAAWCHWCHVMDETTYADPAIGKAIRERFIAIRVDIDERPDLAERYGEWGWPATIVLSSEAEELGKFRGYLPPSELLPILERETPSMAKTSLDGVIASEAVTDPSAPIDALPWIAKRAARDLDAYYDASRGGWGMRQKTPLGADVEIALRAAAAGDGAALGRATQTLVAERALIDRVWGGIYQYSAGSTWNEPHYEKLMTVQASNLEAYAKAYAVTHDSSFLRDARDIERYMTTVLSRGDGAFFTTQDADVNGHDLSAPFIDGKVFYETTSDAGRRALGMPKVDTHVYAFENGRAIAALVSLYEATREQTVLERAERAADVVMRSHLGPAGAVKHDAEETRDVRYLADAASLGLALARLSEVSGVARYRDAAIAIAHAAEADFLSPEGGTLYAHTADSHAAGVFARRLRPFDSNVLMARLLAALARLTGHPAYTERGLALAAALSTPKRLDDQGRLLGEYLLALDELGASTRSGAAR